MKFIEKYIGVTPMKDVDLQNGVKYYPAIVFENLEWDDKDEIRNKILTDDKITNHVLNCSKCMSMGLSNCKEFRTLEGVWDKPNFTNGDSG